MENVMETIENWAESFKNFIIDNQSNPVLWIGIFVIGLAIFGFVYSSLSKNG